MVKVCSLQQILPSGASFSIFHRDLCASILIDICITVPLQSILLTDSIHLQVATERKFPQSSPKQHKLQNSPEIRFNRHDERSELLFEANRNFPPKFEP